MSKTNGYAAQWVKKVDVTGWLKGDMYVRRVSARMAPMLAALGDIGDSVEDQVELLVKCCMIGACDKGGTRLFADDEIDTVRDAPWDAVQTVALAFLEFNKLDGKKKTGSNRKKGSPSRSRSR